MFSVISLPATLNNPSILYSVTSKSLESFHPSAPIPPIVTETKAEHQLAKLAKLVKNVLGGRLNTLVSLYKTHLAKGSSIYRAKAISRPRKPSDLAPIGTATLEPRKENGYQYGIIHTFAVDKRFHRQGIGSGIMNKLIRDAKRQGLSDIYLRVEESNVNAIRFYESFGFIENTKIPQGEQTLVPLIEMVLELEASAPPTPKSRSDLPIFFQPRLFPALKV